LRSSRWGCCSPKRGPHCGFLYAHVDATTMGAGDAKTVMIVRRMRRKLLSKLPWSTFRPEKARPEELKFDILDDREKVIGQLTYTKVGFGLNQLRWKESTMSTPWGEASIQPEKGMGQYRIVVDGKGSFLLKEAGAVLRKGIELTSPEGLKLHFRLTDLLSKLGTQDFEYSDANSYAAMLEEHGKLTEMPAGRPLVLTNEEVKALSKADRPTSVETPLYMQFRIKARGDLPIIQDDLLAILAVYASFLCLMQEMRR
jgi:hypothetical protein